MSCLQQQNLGTLLVNLYPTILALDLDKFCVHSDYSHSATTVSNSGVGESCCSVTFLNEPSCMHFYPEEHKQLKIDVHTLELFPSPSPTHSFTSTN